MAAIPLDDGSAGTPHVHEIAGKIVLGLSLAALLTVLLGVVIHLTQPPQPPPTDEGVLAHIFQLTIVALAGMGLVFLATADWRRPARIARALVVPAIAVVLAFGTLYYFEHYM